ncbi:hypothetical protein [Sedimentitalea nanhaiensis]|uniref:Uncharacterized protein n=1 Tax=Sedimentitalea nanhaiensis TaxID=999627 RepID=A0A1I7C304_9RHOB|nr:hypothetical protein [Sedimentitalea nanhaiensis]SFT93830.1 hypothetical protein SAMN05216236_11410 [Sedimentitalea nanhaiensis]
MANKYEPPTQSGLGQIFDSVFLLALVYIALFIPLVLGLTGAGGTDNMPEVVNWETLEQNPVMQAQWEKLGYTPETAAELITHRFDYTIDPFMLILTGVVILGYFIFMVKASDKEYRDVIREKFDS